MAQEKRKRHKLGNRPTCERSGKDAPEGEFKRGWVLRKQGRFEEKLHLSRSSPSRPIESWLGGHNERSSQEKICAKEERT